jgi:hypothetical protein
MVEFKSQSVEPISGINIKRFINAPIKKAYQSPYHRYRIATKQVTPQVSILRQQKEYGVFDVMQES